jgi:hypothetical protein
MTNTAEAAVRHQCQKWLTPVCAGIGIAGFLADVGHEITPLYCLPVDLHLLSVSLQQVRRGKGDDQWAAIGLGAVFCAWRYSRSRPVAIHIVPLGRWTWAPQRAGPDSSTDGENP